MPTGSSIPPGPDRPPGSGGADGGGQPPRTPITVTPVRSLVIAAVFGALGGWLVVVVSNALGFVPPYVPWTGPLALLIAAALVGVLAWTTWQQIQVRRERVDPGRAVALLVLGKASALAGAVTGGGYLAFALAFVGRWETDGPRERVVRSLIAVVAALALMAAGMLLERACRVPEGDDEDSNTQTEPNSPATS